MGGEWSAAFYRMRHFPGISGTGIIFRRGHMENQPKFKVPTVPTVPHTHAIHDFNSTFCDGRISIILLHVPWYGSTVYGQRLVWFRYSIARMWLFHFYDRRQRLAKLPMWLTELEKRLAENFNQLSNPHRALIDRIPRMPHPYLLRHSPDRFEPVINASSFMLNTQKIPSWSPKCFNCCLSGFPLLDMALSLTSSLRICLHRPWHWVR